MIFEKDNARLMTIALYKDGLPVLINQSNGNAISVKLARNDTDIKGRVKISVYAWGKKWQLSKLKGYFDIV